MNRTAAKRRQERKQLEEPSIPEKFPLFYRCRLRVLWNGKDSPFFGQRCRIVARGALNARMVEFESGERAIVSGNSLRRVKYERENRREPSEY
jgi:hypothetical protein